MDWLSGIFGLLAAVLIILSIILGLLIGRRRFGASREQSTSESQLDRIEKKSDISFLYNLGLTGMIVGLTLIITDFTLRGGWTLFFVGVGLSVAGIVNMFRGRKSVRG